MYNIVILYLSFDLEFSLKIMNRLYFKIIPWFSERDNVLLCLFSCHAKEICFGHWMLNILEGSHIDMSPMTIPFTLSQPMSSLLCETKSQMNVQITSSSSLVSKHEGVLKANKPLCMPKVKRNS